MNPFPRAPAALRPAPWRLRAAALAVAALAAASGCGEREARPPGPRAPDFDLRGLDGGSVQLADYRGQIVLVDFWASWCGPCRLAVPDLIQIQAEYGTRGLQIIGVAVSDREDNVRLFVEQMGVNYVTAFGTPEVVDAFGGFTAIPTAFLVAPDGTVVNRYTGYQPKQVLVEEIEKLLSSVGPRRRSTS